MAISSFGRGKGGEMAGGSPVPPSTTSSSSSSGMGGLTAFIDQGSEFEGKLSFKDTVRIDGTFHGEISSENTLIIGESGEIEATIKSQTVVISGSVVGNVIADKQIVLHKTARVKGDLQTPCVVVEEGAVFNGNLSMNASSQGTQLPSGNLKAIQGGGEKDASSKA
ncbi:MAG: polymer-forming cytoskeletal protein [Deltaproteobacteria bacterium]|nr:polymer-forming cytoskeletal protein [Deltaproteobacteria bacterium]